MAGDTSLWTCTTNAADGAAVAFGFRLYPTLESPPIPLWASSWEERELWKTAMTEGISLLAQKERVLRRDMRKRRRDAEQAGDQVVAAPAPPLRHQRTRVARWVEVDKTVKSWRHADGTEGEAGGHRGEDE